MTVREMNRPSFVTRVPTVRERAIRATRTDDGRGQAIVQELRRVARKAGIGEVIRCSAFCCQAAFVARLDDLPIDEFCVLAVRCGAIRLYVDPESAWWVADGIVHTRFLTPERRDGANADGAGTSAADAPRVRRDDERTRTHAEASERFDEWAEVLSESESYRLTPRRARPSRARVVLDRDIPNGPLLQRLCSAANRRIDAKFAPRVVELHRQGKSVSSICRHLGLTQPDARHYLEFPPGSGSSKVAGSDGGRTGV
jgi:hypothetical protein